MRVLIASDNPAARRLLSSELRKHSHEAVATVDGARAWTEFDRKPVGIVISDWKMPGLDGLEFCRRVRERPRTEYTYFILVTSAGDSRETLRLAMKAGVDDLLAKPVDRELLSIRLHVAQRVVSLESRVVQLQGFLSICAYCKRIRNDKDTYERMETYIEKRTGATFSHTYCPDCIAKHFPRRK